MEATTNLDRIKGYKNRRVLITGHTGFTGSWLSFWLTLLGAEVTGYAIEAPTKPNLYEVLNLKEKVNSIYGNVLDINNFRQVIDQYHPEIIFHLAGMPIVRESYKFPRLTYETNIMGTVNLLDCVRSNDSVKAVVIVTSEKCYKNTGACEAFCEDAPMGGKDPYSSSKACVEILSESWLCSYFSSNQTRTQRVGLGTVRPSNIIGGGDWSVDRLVPDCIRALSSGLPIIVRNPSHRRPWQFVFNPLFGYLLLGSHLIEDPVVYSGGYNLGPSHEDLWSVDSVAKKIIQLWGHGDYKIDDSIEKPYEETSLLMNCEKAESLLGWHPLYDVSLGLSESVSWYRKYYNEKSNMDMINHSTSLVESAMKLIDF
jgi:CDP-glucose 4,6-dehydratase